jgi:hypothetical protein
VTPKGPTVECYGCERAIPVGEQYMSVTYHLEQLQPDGTIAVDLADALVVTCVDCTPPRAVLEANLAAGGLPVWRVA